jgi:UDPglucose--hexose-1-phosphate uridylyltransferase
VVVVRRILRDPFTGDEVILASERVVERRPRPAPDLLPAGCPFCPGNESHTRPTIRAIEREGAWVARAFANKWPALVVEEALGTWEEGPYTVTSGTGAHEVIVEAPEHAPLHQLPLERTEDALRLAVARLSDLRGDRRLQVLQWFRNHGVGAGASQPHPHSQVMGLPLVPRRIRAYADCARAWQDRTGGSLLRAVIEAERRDGRRILVDGEHLLAVSAPAPRHPYEVWFLPTDPRPALEEASEATLGALASAMHRVSRALVAAHGEVPLTAVALSAPHQEDPRGIGWQVRLSPRLSAGAGLEEATGLTVHSVAPERAAEVLRATVPP